jgi:hypothetical protein
VCLSPLFISLVYAKYIILILGFRWLARLYLVILRWWDEDIKPVA